MHLLEEHADYVLLPYKATDTLRDIHITMVAACVCVSVCYVTHWPTNPGLFRSWTLRISLVTASADRVLSDVYLSQLNVPLKMYPTHPFEKKNISVANLTNL